MRKTLTALAAATLLAAGLTVPATASSTHSHSPTTATVTTQDASGPSARGTWLHHNTRSDHTMVVRDVFGRQFSLSEGTSASNIALMYVGTGKKGVFYAGGYSPYFQTRCGAGWVNPARTFNTHPSWGIKSC